MGRRTINKEHRWWGVLPGPQATTPYVVLLRVRVRKKEPRKYSERGRCRSLCARLTDAQSVNFVPPSPAFVLSQNLPSQPRQDYTRTGTRKSWHPALSPTRSPSFSDTLATCARELYHRKGLARTEFRRKRVWRREKKLPEQLLSIFPFCG